MVLYETAHRHVSLLLSVLSGNEFSSGRCSSSELFSTHSGLNWDRVFGVRVKQINGVLTMGAFFQEWPGEEVFGVVPLMLLDWCGLEKLWLCLSVSLQRGGPFSHPLQISPSEITFYLSFSIKNLSGQCFTEGTFILETLSHLEYRDFKESSKSEVSIQATERFFFLCKETSVDRELDGFISWCLRSTCESGCTDGFFYSALVSDKIDVQRCYIKEGKDKFTFFIINRLVSISF